MIFVPRSVKPKTLVRYAVSWTTKYLTAETKEEKKRLEGKYRHLEIKAALQEMFHGKCAYCESKINHVDFGDIEHYRPKARFKKLTFEWTNLLLSCGICNQKKLDRFPEKDEGGPFVNPCEDDPEMHFRFVYDSKCRLAGVYGETERGRITEESLDLNRPDLRKHRSELVRKLHTVLKLTRDNRSDSTIAEALELLREAAESKAEYAAFARQLLSGL